MNIDKEWEYVGDVIITLTVEGDRMLHGISLAFLKHENFVITETSASGKERTIRGVDTESHSGIIIKGTVIDTFFKETKDIFISYAQIEKIETSLGEVLWSKQTIH